MKYYVFNYFTHCLSYFFASYSILLINWIVIKNNEHNHYQSVCTKYLLQLLCFFACPENKSTAIVSSFIYFRCPGNFILPLMYFYSIPWKSKNLNFCRLSLNWTYDVINYWRAYPYASYTFMACVGTVLIYFTVLYFTLLYFRYVSPQFVLIYPFCNCIQHTIFMADTPP